MMKQCFCNRLYRVSIPNAINEYAFSGSLCRVREFETFDGVRYCLTVFSLSDYKHLHFPHDEYKWLIDKLYALITTQTKFPTASKSDIQKLRLNIEQFPFDDSFKIKLGKNCLIITLVTAFGLVNTSSLTGVDDFSVIENRFTCDSKWDICTCKTCPVFKRLIDYEATAMRVFSYRPETVIKICQV